MAPEIINFEDVDLDEIDAYAFVDGSFNPHTEVYGYGGFLIYRYMEDNERKENKLIIKGCGEEYDLVPMRNIAGELLGSRKAMELAITKVYLKYIYFMIMLVLKTGQMDVGKEPEKALWTISDFIKEKWKTI